MFPLINTIHGQQWKREPNCNCRNMTRVTLNILKSPEVIAINQDPLGVAGDLVWKQGPAEVRSMNPAG